MKIWVFSNVTLAWKVYTYCYNGLRNTQEKPVHIFIVLRNWCTKPDAGYKITNCALRQKGKKNPKC